MSMHIINMMLPERHKQASIVRKALDVLACS
jgi:hypothetical protein